ncbi:hypothetical protein EFK50_18770 [Nocardioides marmoriginsengisoli]|uniref:Uncharacterized protein n=1 Tax=Nocardioides marmoriginsengisoli TaxID=661483 RepID=A0A3N0CBF7_9ACTN|nr:hypothetical protein EFK50_18770 [Nocardioides marmoriginsengisoli]
MNLQSDPFLPGYGTGLVQGEIEFAGKFKFDYDLKVSDLCPRDGLGTSFYFVSEMGDGDTALSGVRGYDTDGCGNGSIRYQATLQAQRMIKRTRVAQCTTNDGNLCWTVSTKLGTWKDNPTW